jgi:hypothetical protein
VPDESRRTRAWLWVLGALVVVLAVALVVVLATRDDDSDQASTTSTTGRATTTTGVVSTTAPSTTGAPATTTPTTPPAATVPYPPITSDPQTYGEYLFAAWRNNSRTSAANVASADAVNQMFSQAYPAKGPYTLQGCNPAAGSLYCTWNGQGGATIQMAIRTLTGGLPPQVQSVTFSG